jgi:hypothetical protein
LASMIGRGMTQGRTWCGPTTMMGLRFGWHDSNAEQLAAALLALVMPIGGPVSHSRILSQDEMAFDEAGRGRFAQLSNGERGGGQIAYIRQGTLSAHPSRAFPNRDGSWNPGTCVAAEPRGAPGPSLSLFISHLANKRRRGGTSRGTFWGGALRVDCRFTSANSLPPPTKEGREGGRGTRVHLVCARAFVPEPAS